MSPENSKGLKILTVSRTERETNAPKRARPTKHALPIANPLPIAAVVLPAASSASVLYLAHSFASDISTIPPALSEMGP